MVVDYDNDIGNEQVEGFQKDELKTFVEHKLKKKLEKMKKDFIF